jgi:hypothetical protein
MLTPQKIDVKLVAKDEASAVFLGFKDTVDELNEALEQSAELFKGLLQPAIAEFNGLNAKIRSENAAHIRQMERQELDAQRSLLDHKLAMGQLSAGERLRAEKSLIGHRFDVEATYLNDLLNIEQLAADKRLKIEHQLTRSKAQLGIALRDNNNQLVLEQSQVWRALTENIKGSVSDTVVSLLNGTKSWHDATKDLLNNVLQHFIQTAMKQLMEHMTMEKLKALFTKQKVAEVTATEASGAATETAIHTAKNTTEVGQNAITAGTSGFKALAGIPIVGPALGAAAMAAIMAAIMGMMGKLKSAAGGWGEVPSDQLAMVHKQEMILPAKYAVPLRGMLEGDMDGGGNGGGDNFNINISAMDSQSVEQFFKNNGTALVRAMKAQSRNFAFN